MSSTTASRSDELAFVGLARQAQLLASGELGAVELLDSTLERIEAAQPTLNAFRRLRPEAARAEADEAERRLAAGERLPLLGVPIAIKDDMDLAGEPTAFGCAGEFEPRRSDGEVARRLRAAGAVIVGKTNTPEIGQWPFTEGPAFGATRNPWSLNHTPGGSSGGGCRRPAAGCRRLRRRRLGPHPRRLDPPGRPQAPARAHLHLARSAGLQRPHLLRPADPQRRRRRPAARRARR